MRPSSWRDSPTAKSQMSIISWTSPSASDGILPASIVTSSAIAALCSASRSPRRLTTAPRTGAGTVRQRREGLPWRRRSPRRPRRGPAAGMSKSASPVIGERAASGGRRRRRQLDAAAASAARARSRSSSVLVTVSGGGGRSTWTSRSAPGEVDVGVQARGGGVRATARLGGVQVEGSLSSRPSAPAIQSASRSAPAWLASCAPPSVEVRLEDAGRRARQEVLVDDGWAVTQPPSSRPATSCRRARRRRGRRSATSSYSKNAEVGGGERALGDRDRSRQRRAVGLVVGGQLVVRGARPVAVSAMPRASTSPKRTRSEASCTTPSARRNARGSASARNDVWRSSTSGPVPARRALDRVDHRDAARLHARVQLVDVEHARREVVDVRRRDAADVGRDGGDRAPARGTRPRRPARARARTPASPARGSGRPRRAGQAVARPRRGRRARAARARTATRAPRKRSRRRCQVGGEEPAVGHRQQRREDPERVARELRRASIGRNAVETTGTGLGAASRRS